MRTLSIISIVLVASLSSTIFAQDCSNPLLAQYGLQGLDEPQSGADLAYCSNLQNADTCCSADTVATFQDRANGIVDKLNNYFAAKDLYLAQLRNRYFDRFEDILEDIRSDHSDDLREIRENDASIADQLQSEIDSSNQIRTESRDINNQFVGALDEYQKTRTECFNTALQVQASSWCWACDPNYANQGVANDGSVTFSDGLCKSISDACWPFFNQSAKFNPLIRAREAYWKLAAVARYLDDFSDTDRVVPFNVSADPYTPLSTQQVVEVPDQWVGGSEEAGQCTDLWSGDDLLADLLAVGSRASTGDNNENTQDSGARFLQDVLAEDEGFWAPDLTTTGLDFDNLRKDPGAFFGASDYSDYFGQNQNAIDQTDRDRTDNDNDHTDHDIFDRTDDNN